jgi:gamma-glutamyltranspeptidase/glutathione hydrolase
MHILQSPSTLGTPSTGRSAPWISLQLMPALPVDSADSLHLQIEAMKLAFADVYEYVSDADTMRVRNADLLDQEYLSSRGRLIDMKKAKTPQHGVPGRGGTVNLTAV